MSSSSRREKIQSVVRDTSGSDLEVYDVFVFGSDASAIGKTFFPATSASLPRRLHSPPAGRVAT